MEILQIMWGYLCIYSVFAFIAITALPKPKNKKEAFFQLALSGLIGWGWFLFVETSKHLIKRRSINQSLN
jgi:hypothetical protein